MDRHFVLVRDGVVVNRSVGVPPADWSDRTDWIESETAQIGDSYDGKAFTTPPRPPEPEPEPPQSDPQAVRIAAIESDLAAMKTRMDKLDPSGATMVATVKTR